MLSAIVKNKNIRRTPAVVSFLIIGDMRLIHFYLPFMVFVELRIQTLSILLPVFF